MMTEPTTTSNNLADVIRWVKDGDCVTLYAINRGSQVYHQCNVRTSPEQTRFIYLNLSRHSSLMEDDEWPYYIKNNNCQQCSCSFKEIALEETGEKQFGFKLGY
jgi:hypothetical protein